MASQNDTNVSSLLLYQILNKVSLFQLLRHTVTVFIRKLTNCKKNHLFMEPSVNYYSK